VICVEAGGTHHSTPPMTFFVIPAVGMASSWALSLAHGPRASLNVRSTRVGATLFPIDSGVVDSTNSSATVSYGVRDLSSVLPASTCWCSPEPTMKTLSPGHSSVRPRGAENM
jgi:hypothetical protein